MFSTIILQGVGKGSQHLTAPPQHYVTVCVFQHPFFPICTEQLPSWCFWGLIASLIHTLCLLPPPPKTVTHPHLHLSTSFQPSHFIALLCECQLALSALMHSAGIVVKGVCEGWPASSLRGATRLPPSIATFHLFFSSSSFLTALAAHPCGPGGWSLRSVHGLPCLRWFSLHTFGAGWGGIRYGLPVGTLTTQPSIFVSISEISISTFWDTWPHRCLSTSNQTAALTHQNCGFCCKLQTFHPLKSPTAVLFFYFFFSRKC